VAPLTGRRCTAFRSVVETADTSADGRGSEIFRLERSASIVLVAEGVEARIEGPFLLGLEIDQRGHDGEIPASAFETLALYGVPTRDHRGRPLRLRWSEAALEDGDPIWVFGRAHVAVDRRGPREELRGLPVRRTFGARSVPRSSLPTRTAPTTSVFRPDEARATQWQVGARLT
jgi:hypothetical protein